MQHNTIEYDMERVLLGIEFVRATIGLAGDKNSVSQPRFESPEFKGIVEYLNKLELEVTLLEIYCIEIMGHLYPGNNNEELFEQCFKIYMNLQKLSADLNGIRMDLI